MDATNAVPVIAPASQPSRFDRQALEQSTARSRAGAWWLIAGLPALGITASLYAQLPLFAALMAGCFLLATTLVCHKAMATFTSKTLRLLVTARLVLVLVVGALLFCTSGGAWMAVVSAVLLWLAADCLLGRGARAELKELAQGQR